MRESRESQPKRQGSVTTAAQNQLNFSAPVTKYGGQEQSVERLKNCIADLKKLATSKVKKTSANGTSSNSNLNLANQKYEGRQNSSSYYGSKEQPRGMS